MALKRLEVYIDSYKSRPFIKDFHDEIKMSDHDEEILAQWIGLQAGRKVAIDRDIRIEDVKHHCFDSVESLVHSTCVRVSIVDPS